MGYRHRLPPSNAYQARQFYLALAAFNPSHLENRSPVGLRFRLPDRRVAGQFRAIGTDLPTAMYASRGYAAPWKSFQMSQTWRHAIGGTIHR